MRQEREIKLERSLEDLSMSAAEIQAIKQRAAAATPGPWIEHIEARDSLSGSDVISTGGEDIYMPGASVADYVFVAKARADVPRLVAEIERLRALLDQPA
jgi:hypothetical protein